MNHHPDRRGRRILVIDNDPQIRDLIHIVLKGSGYQAETADHPDLALEKAERSEPPFDLLLVDLYMPEISGLDLAEKVLDKHPCTKILYVSGISHLEEIQQRCQRDWEGKQDFLDKPFRPTELLSKVDELLEVEGS